MSDALRVIVVLGSCAAAMASASAPKQHTVAKTADVRADFDSTWSAAIDVFAEHDWTITNMEKDSGFITTDWMNMSKAEAERFADCGSGPSALHTQVRFNVRVKPESDGASVTVNTTFRQERASLTSSPNFFVDCTSRGGIEAMVQSEVASGARRAVKRSKKHPPPTPTVDAGVADAT